MKNLLVLAFAFFCLNSFAGSIEDAVKTVEVERNAQCTFKSKSTFQKCFGSPKTCFYSVNFSCVNNDGAFGLKIKVKEFFDLQTNAYQTKVRGTVITR